MSRWRFDKEAFARDVLRPVHEGWNPRENLFRVYQLAPDTDDKIVIVEALDSIKRYLASVKAFARGRDILIEQHMEAERCLRNESSRRQHREEVQKRRNVLIQEMKRLLGAAPAVPEARLQQEVLRSRYTHSFSEFLDAVRIAGGDVLDPMELPSVPEPVGWRNILGQLARLKHLPTGRRRSVWVYLSSTAGLRGFSTTAQDLKIRRTALRTTRDTARTAEENLIKFLQSHVNEGTLRQILQFELLDSLRTESTYGWSELLTAANALCDRSAALGLTLAGRDLAYAVWCEQRHPADIGHMEWLNEVESCLAQRNLKQAYALLSSRQDLPPAWQERLQQLADQIEQIKVRFATARRLADNDREEAAACYRELLKEWNDPDIAAALAACHPEPPPIAHATVKGSEIIVSWSPSAARSGRITYRVVRGRGRYPAGPSDGEIVADDVVHTRAPDHRPPVGAQLFYAVFTLRDGNPSIEPCRTSSRPLLPELEDLIVVPDPRGLRFRWTLPAGATGVDITRRRCDLADPKTALTGTSSMLLDVTAVPGVEYNYCFRVRYRSHAGTAVHSSGVTMTACRPETPVGVSDLSVDREGDELALRWTPPPAGWIEVRVVIDGLVENGVFLAADLDDATLLSIKGDPSAGVATAKPPCDLRTYWLVPVTVLGSLVAYGTPVWVESPPMPVRNLRAHVLGSEVQLTWEWPDGVNEVLVVWRSGTFPTGVDDLQASRQVLTRAAYASQGCYVAGLRGQHWFAVATSATGGGRHWYSALRITEALINKEVRYVVREHRWMRGKRSVKVSWDEPELLPPLRIVAKNGTRPRRPSDGVVLEALPRAPSPYTTTVTLPPGMDRPHINVFSDDPGIVVAPAVLNQSR